MVMFSYLRWSSEKQTWGDSERRQAEDSERVCAKQGWTLSDRRFIDRGVSAWKGRNREDGALGELLKIVQPGQGVYLEAVDRWSREDPNDSIVALRKHIERGVNFYFAALGQLVTKENYTQMRMILNMQAEMACQYNERLSYRVREAMQARRALIESGQAVQGPMPCWLKWDETTGKPVVIEGKARVVKRVYEMCLAGQGVRAITTALGGTPPITSGKKAVWNTNFVHRLLTERSVLGEHVASGTPNVYPPVIDEPTFLRVAAKLQERKHLTVPKSRINSNLVTGLATCSRCNSTLAKQTAYVEGRTYPRLVCSGRLRGRNQCTAKGINYDRFEASFLALLKESGLIRKLLAGETKPSPLDDMKLKLADIQRRCDKLMVAMQDDPNPSRRVYAAIKSLEVQESMLQKQVNEEAAKIKAQAPAVDAYDQFEAELGQHLEAPAHRARIRNALRDFVHGIVVELGRNTYHVNFRDAKQAIKVTLHPKGGCLLNPSPAWVLGHEPIAQAPANAAVQAGAKGVLGVVRVLPA
jgi:DNA invertase Pin-like site-specific DNA recombinase